MKIHVLFLLLVSLLSSCAQQSNRSYTTLLPGAESQTITDFITERLMAEYPRPSEQSLLFFASGNKPFDKALEDSARTAGFRVETMPSDETITVQYVIDDVKGTNASYISLKTDKGLNISRTFDNTTYALNSTFLQQDTKNE
ncbi:hypothetical protein [Desulforhopalus singaporensis]|uniref:Conjugal transfer protein TrbH n=1 Tax=Desulforhopalus singaporensis TaxID=91360 RepID=A0A1H0S2U3_9BACT|nr:hypothetical protein [Desulforhopalus singaporensis]SDP35909.1 hypothetical protein SAMN05660330_02502 [Desulforhopalus singaporensis]